ncbi:MAG: hypothetical protein WEB03_07635 [Nitriliruptor sp.]|uniref:arsenate reductase/protein-tyrosine-phosphatase family protein n=1 Tax=Nitriliruptor sp. TaxID=2448056 RepID=UPI0034A06AE8
MSTSPHRVLTVCLGNICRSPTAEAAIVEAAAEADLPVVVRSVGTGAWHVGDPRDPRMTAAAADAGLELTGASELITERALDEADLVVVMDRQNLADVQRIAAAAGIDTPIRLFRAFDVTGLERGDLEVPDPYQGGPAGFALVVEQCRAAAAGVVAHLAGRRGDPGPR